MRANKKDSIAAWSAVAMLGFGMALTVAGFVVPPVGQVHDSVLWILGQSLLYAGSMFGVAMYTKHKLDEISNDINTRFGKYTEQNEEEQNNE